MKSLTTRGMKRLSSLLAFLAFLPGIALGQQSILQGGPFTSGHVPMYATPALSQPIVSDSGTAAGGAIGIGLSELNITSRGSGTGPYASSGTGPNASHFCLYDNPTATANFHFLCFDANSQGGGLITYGAGGTASQEPLSMIINGATYQFPFSTSGVIGPIPTVIGNLACWNNTVGTLLSDCGHAIGTSGSTVPLLNGVNTWSGAQTLNGTVTVGGAINLNNTVTVNGQSTFVGSVDVSVFNIDGNTSGSTRLVAQGVASGSMTLQSGTDILVARATTDTLTNKTYDTAGTGNTFLINGQLITKVTGATQTVLTAGTQLTNTLGGNVNLNNTGSYFDGPVIVQGSTGMWWASGMVSVVDSGGAANMTCKLWDGTTAIAIGNAFTAQANYSTVIALSGYINTPSGNIRISCNDATAATGTIIGSRATVSAFRIQ